ncbi:serine/threonine-protein kinase [Candidatus Uabimicrobium amorphum]|uniref:Protein kinase n=1 Tax=Uabimicrobium amorphum TaxID=2596890 RepID=A0A5S9IL73_UABAM|nr:serine/threonine-protein kinase [Candidatus Uabimicrobium amorphum]BBM82635.1 protein kinase [Candidatus Uabimicrobium amorphum]
MQTLLKNRYQLKQEIGRGGMGTVYLALDTKTNTQVAIKECNANEDLDLQERIKREYQFMTSIDHPCIVKGQNLFKVNKKYFIVMEYVEGISLKDFISNNSWSISFSQQLQIVRDICSAVVALNNNGIIHRDLKPENIILQRNLTPKILDLGIARSTNGELPTITNTGSIIGTPCYVSPEQIDGENSVNNIDVFSLGIIFYQFFSWQKYSPFYAGGIVQSIDKVYNYNPPALTSILQENNSVTSAISDLIDKALKKNPKERIESTQKMLTMLDKIVSKSNLAKPKNRNKLKKVSQVNKSKSYFILYSSFSTILCIFFLLEINNIYKEKNQKDNQVKILQDDLNNLRNIYKEKVLSINSKKYISVEKMSEEILFLYNIDSQWYKKVDKKNIYTFMSKMLASTLKSPFLRGDNSVLLHDNRFLVSKLFELFDNVLKKNRGSFASQELQKFYFLYKKAGIEHSLHPFCEKKFLSNLCALQIDDESVKRDQDLVKLFINRKTRYQLTRSREKSLLLAYFRYVNPGNIFRRKDKVAFLKENINFLKSLVNNNFSTSKHYYLLAKAYQELRREDRNPTNRADYLFQWKFFLEKALEMNNSNSIYLESWFEWYRKMTSFVNDYPKISPELLNRIYTKKSGSLNMEKMQAKDWKLDFSNYNKTQIINNFSFLAFNINERESFLFNYFYFSMPEALRSDYLIKNRETKKMLNNKLLNLREAKNYENRQKILRIFKVKLVKY